MIFDPNPLFHEIVRLYQNNRFDENGDIQLVKICNEGGTRAAKTWDFFHFLVAFCDHNRDQENEIYILRDTLVNCRDFTLKEFKKCLGPKCMNIWDEKNYTGSPKPYYNLFGNHVYFRGLSDEDDEEGYPSDIIFINEALETDEGQIKGLKMRCNKLFVMDWNPKYTQHWCFDWEGQPNVFFTHTTYKNNKHVSKSNRTEILSYEPWEPGSYEVVDRKLMYKGKPIDKKNKPPPHPANTISLNGVKPTADEFRWKVYGLGLRGARTGIIFPNVIYDEKWPEGVDHIYGNDFGFTVDPNALVKYGETTNDIYIQLLFYDPIETPTELNELFNAIEVDKKKLIIADSADVYTSGTKGVQEFVVKMREMNWNMRKVKKLKTVMIWINFMKEKNIHIVKDEENLWIKARTEQESYVMKEMHGIEVNQPADGNDHFWDAARYCYMTYNQSKASH